MHRLFLLLSFLGVSLGTHAEDVPAQPADAPATNAESQAADRKKAPAATEIFDSGVPDSGVPDYIQYEELEDGSSSLQTAVTRFKKGPWKVDLVSVVHLADPAYYTALSKKLSRYDQVLYEMVGGAFQKEAPISPATPENAAPEAAGLRQLQGMASSMLGLKFQLDSIDYEAPNFVHADVTWDQYQSLMTAKNQSFSTFFLRALSLSEEDQLPGMPSNEEGMQLMMQRLMGAVMSGNSSELKRMLAPFLAESESLISKLEGDEGTVLVTERNKVVMTRLKELQQGQEEGLFAIFYGGGHMPDLETRLLAEGYSKKKTIWLAAWEMPNPATEEVVPNPDANPLGMLMKILSENPEIGNMLNELGSSLDDPSPSGETSGDGGSGEPSSEKSESEESE
ncbi:MAG: hypothetical protein P1U85_17970 [Verrucomicrobiales bacterium]|nr:hypothetical protein [Verrucomicrobiales bacterium]